MKINITTTQKRTKTTIRQIFTIVNFYITRTIPIDVLNIILIASMQ